VPSVLGPLPCQWVPPAAALQLSSRSVRGLPRCCPWPPPHPPPVPHCSTGGPPPQHLIRVAARYSPPARPGQRPAPPPNGAGHLLQAGGERRGLPQHGGWGWLGALGRRVCCAWGPVAGPAAAAAAVAAGAPWLPVSTSCCMMPCWLLGPTASTSMRPNPSSTLLPLISRQLDKPPPPPALEVAVGRRRVAAPSPHHQTPQSGGTHQA